MKKEIITGQGGFTLIETIMAMAIFTIGILGLFGMQTASIKENLSANSISIGSAWAADQVETILATDYTDLLKWDVDGDGCTGLSDWQGNPTSADGKILQNGIPAYTVYVNVARNCLLSAIPDASIPSSGPTLEQKPLRLRIIVTVDNGSGEEERATFNYIKQNSAKDV